MNRKVSAALLLSVALVFSLGLMMVFNTTSAEVLDRSLNMSTHHALIRQLIYAFLSFFAAWLALRWGYQKILQMSSYLLGISIVFLFLVFVPGIGNQINGATRWVKIGGFSFQPSEFVKLVMPLYYIKQFARYSESFDKNKFYRTLGILGVPFILILIEPDNGLAGMIFCTFIVLFFLTGVKWKYWALPLLVLAIGGGVYAMQSKHVPDRIRIYLHPETDLLGKGHQPYQAKIAAGSGQLFGRGLGESLQKLDYLPTARSDYIAAIYAEECGFMGMVILIVLYMLIAYFGFYIAHDCKDSNGFYIATSLTFMISFQAFLNLGVVSGLLPSKGINLPFFSHGGSSLISNVIALALLLDIARKAKKRVAL